MITNSDDNYCTNTPTLTRLTVYPVMPTTNLQDSQSDRAVLSRPSLVLVTWLLDSSLDNVTKVRRIFLG